MLAHSPSSVTHLANSSESSEVLLPSENNHTGNCTGQIPTERSGSSNNTEARRRALAPGPRNGTEPQTSQQNGHTRERPGEDNGLHGK
jgi:hypothetical protein